MNSKIIFICYCLRKVTKFIINAYINFEIRSSMNYVTTVTLIITRIKSTNSRHFSINKYRNKIKYL